MHELVVGNITIEGHLNLSQRDHQSKFKIFRWNCERIYPWKLRQLLYRDKFCCKKLISRYIKCVIYSSKYCINLHLAHLAFLRRFTPFLCYFLPFPLLIFSPTTNPPAWYFALYLSLNHLGLPFSKRCMPNKHAFLTSESKFVNKNTKKCLLAQQCTSKFNNMLILNSKNQRNRASKYCITPSWHFFPL